ncbi:M57 family metalloprotease [Dyadobacter sp. LJ419]|uniref:M57 family metalloprotease n=1 Tax=Dyadobacter chenwenxiniae TaxID=2906456 RepID=A0A9X1PQR4_9BACT|nr:M57 family metalloprotease [Dyadobacter chenwenxiniae]MCF0064775.1 M57 family metalloprotease [Dyadobacter chenwenxiniae]
MKKLFTTCMPQTLSYLARTMLLIALLTAFQSCKEPDIINEPAVLKQDEKDTQLQTLSSFLAGVTGAPIDKVKYINEEKKFVIDGDMEISRTSAEEYLNAEKTGRVNQKRAVWLLSDNVAKDVKVYINPSITPEWKEAVREAIYEWNHMGDMKVNFREVLFDYNTDVVVTAKYEGPNPSSPQPWIARQNMPDIDGTTGGGMTINTYYNSSSLLSKSEKKFAMVHELGHVIGFAHTDKPTQGLIDFLVCDTPVWDANSVMNFVVGSWTMFSYYDHVAAMVLYPEHTWKNLPGQATDVAASTGTDRVLWMISKTPVNGGFTINKFNYLTNSFTQVPGGGVRIAVGPDGTPWVVNNLGQIFKRVNSQWQMQPGNAHDIAVGADGSVYIVSTTPAAGGFAIKKWKNNKWEQISGIGGMRIAVASYGFAWVIDNANRVLKYNGINMEDTGALGRDIAAGRNNSIFVIGQTPVPGGYSIKKFEKDCWVQLAGGGVAISAHGTGTQPVIINNSGVVMEY